MNPAVVSVVCVTKLRIELECRQRGMKEFRSIEHFCFGEINVHGESVLEFCCVAEMVIY